MSRLLKLIIADSDLSAETKLMAIQHESAVQWYIATVDAIAERRNFSPLAHNLLQATA